MTLTHIAVFILIALVSRFLVNKSISNWIIFSASILFVFWLQPISSIRTMEFWLPSLLIIITIIVWTIVSDKETLKDKENIICASTAAAFMLVSSLLRYISPELLTGIINPPEIGTVVVFLAIAGAIIVLIQSIKKNSSNIPGIALISIVLLIGALILLKYQPLTEKASFLLRKINGQSTFLANAQEIAWIGYSYFAFRLIHVLREWQQGRAFNTSLLLFMIYVLFFPSITAGPIDRLDRFQKEYTKRGEQSINDDILQGGIRISKGLFYKFIVADSLALIAFNSNTVNAVNQGFWLWIIIYCYALRLYFDFSGYTDIAIGIAKLMGIKLPENFKNPYRSTNLALFWNRWHITLTQWFRTYYFNPVTRYLRTREKQLPISWIILFTQISTMILIGLWHGISPNFVIWGLWNGLGLFIQNRWSEWRKSSTTKKEWPIFFQKLSTGFSIIATFNFIALGWVWFALPTLTDSIKVFSKLLGVA